MSTPSEREEMRKRANEIIEEASGGNKSAAEYLYMMAVAARVTDDVFDEFDQVDQKDVENLVEILFIKLPFNTFFQEHRDTLLSQHLLIWNTWINSNFLMNGDETDQIYAHVYRETFNELSSVVALITQGYEAMERLRAKSYFAFKKKLGE